MSDLLYIPNAVDHDHADRLQSFLESVPTSPSGTFDSRTFAFRRLQLDGSPVDSRLEASAGHPVWTGDGYGRGPDVPDELAGLMRTATEHVVERDFMPDSEFEGFTSVYVDRYECGGSFQPHVDRDGYGPVVAGYSIGPGRALLTFASDVGIIQQIDLEPRSMYAFRGALRAEPVVHSVSGVSDLRFGITFRTAA